MSVFRRNYDKERGEGSSTETTWSYSFSHRKYRYRQSGFATKRAAEMAEAKAKEEAMIKGLAPRSYSDIGFTDLVDQFFSGRTLTHAPSTIESETAKANTLRKFFRKMPVGRITIADVEQYRNRRLGEGRARRTVNLELILLRCIIGYAVDHGYAQENPAKRVKNLKPDKVEKVIPSTEDFRRLLKAAGKTTVGRPLVVWIWLSALSGLRHTESFFLEWADVSFEKGLIFVRPKEGSPLKDREWRSVEIHQQLLPILQAWKSDWDAYFAKRKMDVRHNWVFYNPRRPSLRCQTFRKAFEAACEKAGLVGVTMNSMRHFFISIALMSGVQPRTISEWAGHANTKMVEQVYSHLQNRFKQEQMALVKIEAASGVEAGPRIGFTAKNHGSESEVSRP